MLKAELNNPISCTHLAQDFNKAIYDVKTSLSQIIQSNEKISIYGASGRGAMLINICQFSHLDFKFATDLSTRRVGHYLPGTFIPIYDRSYLKEHPCDIYILLAWNYISEVLANEKDFLDNNGVIYTPLPYPRIHTKQGSTLI